MKQYIVFSQYLVLEYFYPFSKMDEERAENARRYYSKVARENHEGY